MFKIKRWLCVFMLYFLLFLAACTQTTNNKILSTATPVSNDTPVPSPTSSMDNQEGEEDGSISLPTGVAIEFWHPWSGELENVIRKMADEFNQSNEWHIQVIVTAHADEQVLLEDITEAFSSGEIPTMIAAPSQFLQAWYQEGNNIQDLNPFINSSEWGLSKDQVNSFISVFWKTDVAGDIRLGVPAYRSGNFLFYNKGWAEELGFTEAPVTSAEFRQQACAAAAANSSDNKSENNGTGGWVYDTNALTLLSWLKAFGGGSLVNSHDQMVLSEENNQHALEYLYDLFLQDCAWIGKQKTPYQYFSKRYALFYSGEMQDIFIQEKTDLEENNQDSWVLIPYPTETSKPMIFVDGSSYAILNQDADKSLAAWLFIRFLSEPENQARIIETNGALPVSTSAITLLSDFRKNHPAWDQTLQNLPYAEPAPVFSMWESTRHILSDLAWQLIQFNTARQDVPDMLVDAEELLREINE